MRPRPVLLASVVLAGLTVAASPAVAASTSNVQTTVTTLTAPQTMPILFAGTAGIFGHRVNQGAPIPAGAAALKVTFTPQATQDTLFTVTCPAGLGVADSGEPAGVPGLGGGMAGPFGENVTPFHFEPPAPGGPVDFYVLCLPIAKASTKRLDTRTAPVRFPSPEPGFKNVKAIAKGARLKPNQVLLQTTLTGLTKGQAALSTITCPRRLVPTYGAVATTGFGGTFAGDTFVIHEAQRGGSATLYTVCQAPVGVGP